MYVVASVVVVCISVRMYVWWWCRLRGVWWWCIYVVASVVVVCIKESQSSCEFGWLGLGFLRGGHEMRCLTISAVEGLQMRAEPVGYQVFTMSENPQSCIRIMNNDSHFLPRACRANPAGSVFLRVFWCTNLRFSRISRSEHL